MRNLFLGERGIARTADRSGLVDFLNAAERICADQLALAIEVGRNADAVGLLRQVLQRADDVLFLRQLFDGGIHKVRKRLELPPLDVHAVYGKRLLFLEGGLGQTVGQRGGHVGTVSRNPAPTAALLVHQLRREIRGQDVPAQADGHPFLAVNVESVDRRVENFVLLCRRTQRLRDFFCSIVLLGYYQFHWLLLS